MTIECSQSVHSIVILLLYSAAVGCFQKCDQDQSDRKEEDQRQHAVFGVVEKVCTEGNDQRAEEVRKLAEYVKEAEVFAGFVLGMIFP